MQSPTSSENGSDEGKLNEGEALSAASVIAASAVGIAPAGGCKGGNPPEEPVERSEARDTGARVREQGRDDLYIRDLAS